MTRTRRVGRIQRPDGRSATRRPGIAAAAAAVSAVSGGVLALSVNGHSYSLTVLLASGAISITLVLVSALGGQAANLLWTILYSRMMKALIREGIRHITDIADVHCLMADLRESAAGLHSNGCNARFPHENASSQYE
jgi:hypothetical protein